MPKTAPRPLESPRYESCDMTKPEEHFLWALAHIPMGDKLMPIAVHVCKIISKHLWELGFRHHPSLQVKKFQPAIRGGQHNLNGLHRWVPMDTPDVKPLVLPDVKAMTTEEREWIHQELKNVGHIREKAPDVGPTARVSDFTKIRHRRTRSSNDLPRK